MSQQPSGPAEGIVATQTSPAPEAPQAEVPAEPPVNGDGSAETPPLALASAQDEGQIQCIICHDEMKVGQDDILGLPCAHAFHRECIEKYASCKQLPLEQCCPYRCFFGLQLDLTDDEGTAGASGSGLDAETTSAVDAALAGAMALA